MKNRPEFAKLAELRAKTNRRLASIVTHQLELGLCLARIFASRNSIHEHHFLEQAQEKAERIYSRVFILLPLTYHLSEPERRRLESKLKQLRETLDEVSAPSRARTAC